MQNKSWLIVRCAILTLLSGILGWFLFNIAGDFANKKIATDLTLGLNNTSALLSQTLSKPLTIARLDANSGRIQALIRTADHPNADEQADQLLERYKQFSGSLHVTFFSQGGTLEAADVDSRQHKGKDFSFRPFVQQALAGQENNYFAFGVTDKLRGYYTTIPVFNEGGSVAGAIMVKYLLDESSLNIDKYAHMYLVSPDGIVLLASNPDWLLKSIYPLSDSRRNQLIASRQFGTHELEQLNLRWLPEENKAKFNNDTYLFQEFLVNAKGWKLIMFEPDKLFHQYQSAILTLVAGFFMLVTGGLFFHFKQQQNAEILKQYNLELESNVSERTKKMDESIRKLKLEVAERKQLEADLTGEKEFIDVALDSQLDTFFVFDPATDRPLRWNKAFTRISSYSDKEIYCMKALENYFSPSDAKTARKYLKKILQGSTETVELDLITKTGDIVPTEYSASVIREKTGKPKYFITVGRDISERKIAQEEKTRLESDLQQAQKMESIGTLAGGIAHDFNNILTAILGYSEIALMEIPRDSGAASDIGQVIRACNRAKDLVNQILTFSRQSNQELQPLKIQLVIKEALKLLRSSIPTTIAIHKNINPQCTPVLADLTQIHQVIMNLCTNAYHAMRETGGALTVSLQPLAVAPGQSTFSNRLSPGSYVQVEITDTGHGIEKDDLDRIFEPYFSTKAKGEGTGLGLAVVHGIVKSYNGVITVDSEPGEGTTFRIILPAVAAARENIQKNMPQSLPTGNERILLVDDDVDITRLHQKTLQTLGYTVTALNASSEALAAFQRQPDNFDCIITDMTMPEMTGAELAEHLQAIRPGIPIILCTGFSELVNKKRAKEIGVTAFIMKPVALNDFAGVVRKALDGLPT